MERKRFTQEQQESPGEIRGFLLRLNYNYSDCVRAYIYKLTADEGSAPCAPGPLGTVPAFLSLAICKPAIRRTARDGDLVIGISGTTLHKEQGYPLAAVIYAGVVSRCIQAHEYYRYGEFSSRLDCIYRFDELGRPFHVGTGNVHRHPSHLSKDLGKARSYKNAWVLRFDEYRYFGISALAIPEKLVQTKRIAAYLSRGHRVAEQGTALFVELSELYQLVLQQPTTHTFHNAAANDSCNCKSRAGDQTEKVSRQSELPVRKRTCSY